MSVSTPRDRSIVGHFAQVFWTTFGSLAVIAGLYWGAASAGWARGFWLVLGLAIAAAVLFVGAPRLATGVKRMRDYPGLLAEVNGCREEVACLEEESTAAAAAGQAAYEAGLAEGERRGQGAFLALLGEPPEIVGVGRPEGKLILLGLAQPEVPYGSWFEVVARDTGTTMGIVAVSMTMPDSDRIYLECVEETVPRFWAGIADRADQALGAPDGVILRRYAGCFDYWTRERAAAVVRALGQGMSTGADE